MGATAFMPRDGFPNSSLVYGLYRQRSTTSKYERPLQLTSKAPLEAEASLIPRNYFNGIRFRSNALRLRRSSGMP